MDKFDKWNEVKKELEQKTGTGVANGEVYWLSVGQNLGSETYGKGADFKRPVLVLNKVYIKNYINAFIGVPLSSKASQKSGCLYHKFTDKQGIKQVALLAQIRLFDTKRVISNANISVLKADFEKIKIKVKDKIIR
ncbi:toxin-antitoxin protein, putative [Campylobacter concisus UNSWCS]|uniref:Toxin-antitoxin protein, putative n=1 Tax=Campylobacter concisus UNSWCS TaxID=1242968 RepID=U2FB68_9BACT|nr:type II toxin-antitoxin system PemK/MazF family toxin [Campylobacter concisus]ERJ27285.1 toxin-antitoxin protein, putative [Campylobacter concisus UNSWCS]